jgi:hypothetical protein
MRVFAVLLCAVSAYSVVILRPIAELKKCRANVVELKTRLEHCGADKKAMEAGGEQSNALEEKLNAANREIQELRAQLETQGAAIAKTKEPVETISTNTLAKQQTPWFCTPEVSDNQAWRAEAAKKRETKEHFGPDGMQAKWYNLTINPTYWCNKLTNNLEPWTRPTITTDDVVVGIYTGESLFYSRAVTTRDTWLLNFKHHYIFSAKSEPRIPVIGLLDLPKYKSLVHDEESENAQWAQLIGLKEMYERSPNQKWYYIVGCDNFIDADNVLRRLEKFDASKPYVLAQYANPSESLPEIIDISKYPKYQQFPESMK